MSLPCYHGYIAREDLTNILSNTGDYLIRRTILNENRNKVRYSLKKKTFEMIVQRFSEKVRCYLLAHFESVESSRR